MDPVLIFYGILPSWDGELLQCLVSERAAMGLLKY